MMRPLLAWLTFPGVIVHEFAHAWACRRLGIHVEQVCYLRFGNPMGFVLHARPSSSIQHTMVAVAPFFVSTLLALAASLGVCLVSRFQPSSEVRDAALLLAMWCSFSMALHALPSSGDADALWHDVQKPDVGLCAKLLLVPAVATIRLTQMGTHMWLDVLFALAVVALPPALLLILTG